MKEKYETLNTCIKANDFKFSNMTMGLKTYTWRKFVSGLKKCKGCLMFFFKKKVARTYY